MDDFRPAINRGECALGTSDEPTRNAGGKPSPFHSRDRLVDGSELTRVSEEYIPSQ